MRPTVRRQLRKAFPKDQILLDGVLSDETVRAIREAHDDDAFELVDDDLETDYCCPSCGYQWSGNPKPNQEKTDGKS